MSCCSLVTVVMLETRNSSRKIPLRLLGSQYIITVINCMMALSPSMRQTYTVTLMPPTLLHFKVWDEMSQVYAHSGSSKENEY